jgi:hypothetical protein
MIKSHKHLVFDQWLNLPNPLKNRELPWSAIADRCAIKYGPWTQIGPKTGPHDVARKKLSAIGIPTLAPGTYADNIVPGLLLIVGKNRKTWAYRYRSGGKRPKFTLGYQSIEAMANAIRLTERAVQKNVRKLQVLGLLEVGANRGGYGRSNCYTLTLPADYAADDEPAETPSGGTPVLCKDHCYHWAERRYRARRASPAR